MVKKYYRPKVPIEHKPWFQEKKVNLEAIAGRTLTDAEVYRIIALSNARLKTNVRMMQELARKKTI